MVENSDRTRIKGTFWCAIFFVLYSSILIFTIFKIANTAKKICFLKLFLDGLKNLKQN
jgi:hypothetical protein